MPEHFLVSRSNLEYPSENVSLTYLEAIDKTEVYAWRKALVLATRDPFTDKAIRVGAANYL